MGPDQGWENVTSDRVVHFQFDSGEKLPQPLPLKDCLSLDAAKKALRDLGYYSWHNISYDSCFLTSGTWPDKVKNGCTVVLVPRPKGSVPPPVPLETSYDQLRQLSEIWSAKGRYRLPFTASHSIFRLHGASVTDFTVLEPYFELRKKMEKERRWRYPEGMSVKGGIIRHPDNPEVFNGDPLAGKVGNLPLGGKYIMFEEATWGADSGKPDNDRFEGEVITLMLRCSFQAFLLKLLLKIFDDTHSVGPCWYEVPVLKDADVDQLQESFVGKKIDLGNGSIVFAFVGPAYPVVG